MIGSIPMVKACPNCNTTSLRQLQTSLWKCYGCKQKITSIVQRAYRGNGGIRKKSEDIIEVPEFEEFVGLLRKIEDLKVRAFLALLYLSALRITEVVGDEKRKIPCLTKKQFINKSIKIKDGFVKIILIIKVPILKKKHFDKIPTKPVPLFIEKETELAKMITDYLSTLPTPESPLFDFSRNWGWQLVKTHLGPDYYTHFLRRTRITHLIELYGWNDWEVKEFIKWSDTRPMVSYVNLALKDLTRKMV